MLLQLSVDLDISGQNNHALWEGSYGALPAPASGILAAILETSLFFPKQLSPDDPGAILPPEQLHGVSHSEVLTQREPEPKEAQCPVVYAERVGTSTPLGHMCHVDWVPLPAFLVGPPTEPGRGTDLTGPTNSHTLPSHLVLCLVHSAGSCELLFATHPVQLLLRPWPSGCK